MNRRGARAALLAFAVTAAAERANADNQKAEAQVLFTQGVKLAESGDLRGALAAFRAAHEKFPSYRVLYNVGQLCTKLADPACTVRAYDQYLREGGSEVPAKRRAEVEAELASARKSVAMLTITTNVTGAEIAVDDEPVGTSPLSSAVAINPGSRSVVLHHEGKTIERTVKAAAGDTPSVDLEIPKDPPPARTDETPLDKPGATDNPPAREASPRKIPIVPWAAFGGLAVVTIVSGIFTAGAYSSYTDKRDSFPVTRGELDDAQGSARTLFLVTTVFGALTVASAVVAAYFTFRPTTAAATSPGSAAATDLRVGLGPRGVLLQGAW
jgi:hypothetical protein